MNRYTPTLIFLALCLVVCLVNWNCASTNSITGEEEIHYPLIDTRLKIHKYKHNIQWQFFVKANPRTEYCSVHFECEDIQPLYRKINEEMPNHVIELMSNAFNESNQTLKNSKILLFPKMLKNRLLKNK